MNSHKLATASSPAKSPTLRERAAQARDAAGRFLKRAAGQVTDQPQSASLPEASAANRQAGAFPTAAQASHNAGRGHSADFDRAPADHGLAPHREHDMGRHETFENAAPIADELLTGTMLGRAATFAEQITQASLTGDVLAGSGIDHRDGTVSYTDATGVITRRPMARWVAFNAMQMHSHVQAEIGRRRVIEANPLSADEHADWDAKIRRELRADAISALTLHPERAFQAEHDRRSGAEPTTAEGRAETDAMLLALAPEWEAARDAYAHSIQRQEAIVDAALTDGRPGPAPAGSGPAWQDWFRRSKEWRERTGVEAAEDASGDACCALGEIEDRIAELPAASLAGLRLKARVAQRNEDIDIEWPEKLGEGLIRDLLALGVDGLADENPVGDILLLQLGRQFEAARKRETAACEACNAAQEEVDRHMPERPATLLFRASDHPLRLRKFLTHPDHLEGVEVTSEDVEWMKRKPYVREVRRPVRPQDNLPADAHTVVEAHPWPEAQERADEIVTTWEAWHAEKLRIHCEYVTAALDDAANEAGELATDLALRIAELPARTVAGFRVKLRALACYNPSFFYLNPPELPDPDQALAYSLGRDVRGEAPATAEHAASAVEPSHEFVAIADDTKTTADAAPSLVGMLDLASATMDELQTIRDVADHVGSTAYAHAWRACCHLRASVPGITDYNAAGKLMHWLGDALTDVETAVDKEAARRVPDNSTDRETRLSMRAVTIIDNGDPDEIVAFAGELLAHAATELAGR